jgi:hypothetical protein
MCHSGCFYENSWGDCKGIPHGTLTITPHCFEDGVEAYNESVEHDEILNWELNNAEVSNAYP